MTEVFRPSFKYAVAEGFAQIAAIFIILLIFSFEALLKIPIYFLLIIVISIIKALITYYTTYYEIRDNGVFIRKGLISRKQSLFLYTQIQDVEEFKGVWDRIFAIGNLRIVTMSGASVIQGVVLGLDREESLRFRNLVIDNVNKTAKKEVLPTLDQASKTEFRINPYVIHAWKGIKYSILNWIVLLLSLLGFIVLLPYTNFNSVIVLVLGLFALNLFFIFIVYLTIAPYKYSISKDWLQLRYKFLVERISNYRFDRIQNVTIKQSWNYRLGGLACLLIETGEKPAYSSKERENTGRVATMIPALDIADAYRLKNEILEKMGLPKEEKYTDLRQLYPLDSQKPLKKTVSFAFKFVLLAVVAAFVIFNFFPAAKSFGVQSVLFIALGIIIALIILKYIYEIYYFRNYSYKTTSNLLVIKKGLFEYTEVFLPYSRVQNFFIDMDIFDRFFDLRDVHLSTIGYSTIAHAHIDGVNPENAGKLKDMILNYYIRNKK